MQYYRNIHFEKYRKICSHKVHQVKNILFMFFTYLKYTIYSLAFCHHVTAVSFSASSKWENLFTFLFTCHFTISMAFCDFECTENSRFVPIIISHTHYSRLSTTLPGINSKNSQVIHFQKAHKPKSSQKTESTPCCSIVSDVDYFRQLECFG